MKKKIKFIFIAFITTSFLGMYSCKKDEKESAKEKIQDKNFYMTNIVSKENNVVVETIADYDPCELDNIFRLNSNGTGSFDEGATKCDPTDEQTIPFNWTMTNNDTKLNLSVLFFTESFDILENNGTTLRLLYTEVDSGYVYTSETTYTRL